MIEATVTGTVCADVPQTSREVGGLTQWTLTLMSLRRDGQLPDRVDVVWVGERSFPFDDGVDLVARGALHVCSCGASQRLVMRAIEVREVHAEVRARYAALRLAADGGNDAA